MRESVKDVEGTSFLSCKSVPFYGSPGSFSFFNINQLRMSFPNSWELLKITRLETSVG